MSLGLNIRKHIVENCNTFIVIYLMKMNTCNKIAQLERIKVFKWVMEFKQVS